MPFALELEKANTEVIAVRLEPAFNALGSALLLAKNDDDPGIHDWVARTRAAMSKDELFRHRLVMIGFHYAVMPRESFPSFAAYLTHLEGSPPSVLRDTMLHVYAEFCTKDGERKQPEKPVDWSEILTSAKSYVDFLRQGFDAQHVDEELETRAYDYVLDPAAMKQLILDHLRWFWKNHLEREWVRVRPMIEKSVRAFQRVDFADQPRDEIARQITGQDLTDMHWQGMLEKAARVVFIPNAHIGAYIQKAMMDDTLFIYFGARQPDGLEERIPELDRADIVSRLAALADDTRLQILQMIGEGGELRTQDIMDATQLSQPSVSRYLTQLTATGYLQERRIGGAKAYALNRERIEKTIRAVTAFLLDH